MKNNYDSLDNQIKGTQELLQQTNNEAEKGEEENSKLSNDVELKPSNFKIKKTQKLLQQTNNKIEKDEEEYKELSKNMEFKSSNFEEYEHEQKRTKNNLDNIQMPSSKPAKTLAPTTCSLMETATNVNNTNRKN
ncbi:unnamed protein product [Rotaria sordida]|uniref:Uncharacterized protein n=1 Tax=Rotaria sordida TaxID=392033 RepID=A0A819VHF6_9BILA|nr:unnamed protein product [Rotaria sordida]